MRAMPGRLCMGESVPFGQRHNYHAAHPIEMMLEPDYFLSVKTRLQAGDEIRIVRVINERVTHLVDMLVVQIHQTKVELMALSPVREVPADDTVKPVAPPEPQERYVPDNAHAKWNLGKQMFEIWCQGRVLAEVRGKDEAHRIAAGELMLPVQEVA